MIDLKSGCRRRIPSPLTPNSPHTPSENDVAPLPKNTHTPDIEVVGTQRSSAFHFEELSKNFSSRFRNSAHTHKGLRTAISKSSLKTSPHGSGTLHTHKGLRELPFRRAL